jgi:L-malate glycosyltransferase
MKHGVPKPNVLWLIKGLGLGGAEMLLPMSLPHVDRSAFNYHVGYFLPWKDALVPKIAAEGVPPICFDIARHGDPRAVSRLIRYIRQHRIDLIHAHLPYPGMVARLAGRITGAKVVYTEHNVWGRLNPLMRAANRVTFGMNDWAIAVSRGVANSIRGVDKGRLSVIDNGIDCSRLAATPDESAEVRTEFGIPASDFLIGKVANLTPKKNHENLIEAFALLHRQRPESTLLLVGQPAGREAALRELAVGRGVGNKVVFAGARTDVPRLVRAMDVFAISSDFEGLPIAMLEAMALAKPIVATTVGGIPGVIRDGVEGILLPPQRPDLLAAALQRLFDDRGLARTMGIRSQERVRAEYDIAQMVTKVEAIYRNVLNEGRAHGNTSLDA